MAPHGLTEGAYFIRFIVALLLGVAIGFEREWRQRMAGLHTTAMVAAGAAMFAMIAPLLEAKGADPTRIAAQVVSGIGFLAGGVILRQGANVRGLTTAATLWATSAVGVLAGFGFFTQALGAAIAIIMANLFLYPLTRYIDSIKPETSDIITTYIVDAQCSIGSQIQLRTRIADFVEKTRSISLAGIQSKAVDESTITLRAQFSQRQRAGRPGEREDNAIETLVQDLAMLPGVSKTQWQASSQFI